MRLGTSPIMVHHVCLVYHRPRIPIVKTSHWFLFIGHDAIQPVLSMGHGYGWLIDQDSGGGAISHQEVESGNESLVRVRLEGFSLVGSAWNAMSTWCSV